MIEIGGVMKLTAAAAAATLLFGAAASSGAVAEALFESRRLTTPGEYPDGIEGPAVDAAGNLYVVNLGHSRATGRSITQPFAEVPRFQRDRLIDGTPFYYDTAAVMALLR